MKRVLCKVGNWFVDLYYLGLCIIVILGFYVIDKLTTDDGWQDSDE